MFSNILIYFVVIPLIMLAGLTLCRNIRQIRAVAVIGSLALTALSVWLLLDYLALRAAGETAPMLYTGSWSWFGPLNINLSVGVDGISIAMLILSSIILLTGSFASWKIEIKSHPELTEKGNADSDSQYYTQSELRDLVNYAARRHVTIVPELDVPGHTAALLAAYPELCCTGVDTAAIKIGKTHGLMLCASNEKVYTLYKDIITEVAQLFPGEYIHLGGDESVIDSNWGKCEADSILMSSKGYTSPAQLMNHFFGEILETVRSNGKKAVLWCELDRIYPPANEYLFDYPQDVTLVTWRNGLTPKCIELTAKHGNKLIMAPGEYAYLDYPQLKGDLPEWNNWGMPVTTLRKSYEFDPSYGMPDSDSSYIVGVMATLWGEAIADINRAMYMTYPRALAIAEAAWSAPERRNWNSFKKRMLPNIYDMMCSGISVRVPFEVMAE